MNFIWLWMLIFIFVVISIRWWFIRRQYISADTLTYKKLAEAIAELPEIPPTKDIYMNPADFQKLKIDDTDKRHSRSGKINIYQSALVPMGKFILIERSKSLLCNYKFESIEK